MTVQHMITAVIRHGEETGYVAECVELPVVTQGDTLDHTVDNLREAVELQLEDEDPAEFGLTRPLTIIATFEIVPSVENLDEHFYVH